jgi:RNA polymerase sigma-70 factor (ECF subfamily)
MDGVGSISRIQDVSGETAVNNADDALANRISSGDTESWQTFFGRFSTWTYRFAHFHLRASRADAEDLTSEILLTAVQSIRQFDSRRGSLDLWLLGIARHCLARFCRRRRLEVPSVPEITGTDLEVQGPADLPLSETALTRHLVNRALASLPERQSTVLIGKYIHGHSVEELAVSMDSTPKAVESLLSRARAAFRTVFTMLFDADEGGKVHERP